MSWYRTGTISLTNGSKNVTGTGTLFVSNVKSGFALLAPDFSVYEVDNISSDTAFTLKENYRGSTVSSGSYAIFQTQGIIKDLTDEVTALINTFGAFRDAYTNGDLVGAGLELKGVLNSPSDLPSNPATGDTYLIGTYLYVYTGSVGGWKNSNIAGIIPKGAWNASTAYSINDTVTYSGSQYRRKVAGTTSTSPDSDTTNWELFVSIGNTGPAGITPRGTWNSATAYVVNDTVQYNGSQYRRIVAGTTSTDPSTDTTNWELFVSKGLDGLGSVVKVNNVSPDLNGNVTLTSDNIAEGSTNQWFTVARVRATLLTGLSTVTSAAIAATDSVLGAFAKLQAQISDLVTNKFDKSGGTFTGAVILSGDATSNLNPTTKQQVDKRVGTAGSPSFRNKILNGGFRFNQRGYVSGTATTSSNQFTFDGWFVNTSGQNITFTASGSGNVVTAPAGGFSHVIRGLDIEGGVYTLSWTGTATATVNGTAITNGGQTSSLTAGSNVVVSFSSGTVSNVVFEAGTVATPYSHMPYELEFEKCKSRYQKLQMKGYASFTAVAFSSSAAAAAVRLPVDMIAAPSVTLPPVGANSGQFLFSSSTGDQPSAAGSHTVSGQTINSFYINASGYSGTGWGGSSGVLLFAPTEVSIVCVSEITS